MGNALDGKWEGKLRQAGGTRSAASVAFGGFQWLWVAFSGFSGFSGSCDGCEATCCESGHALPFH